MIAVSTSWRSSRITDGGRLLDAILDAGAEAIELEYRVTGDMFSAMRPRLAAGDLRVPSVHDPFPRPDFSRQGRGTGDPFLSSEDEEERRLALAQGIGSLEAASDVGASAVVFHLGKAPMANGSDELKAYFDEGTLDSGEALRFKRELLAARRRLAPKAVDRVMSCLDKLLGVAGKYSVTLGVENRFHPSEIPDFDEIGLILSRFEGAPIGYWHDVGHAVVQERFGICAQRGLLEAYGSRMVGIHLHDVVGYDDHWAPGMGEVDFAEIAPNVPAEAVRVVEVHSKVERDELVRGVQYAREAGLG